MKRGRSAAAALLPALAFGLALMAGLPAVFAQAQPGEPHPCDSAAPRERIEACTRLIETPGASPTRLATAYANRGLARVQTGAFEAGIPDYDRAIELFPEFAVALNNRGWAKFKLGRLEEALADVEKSLGISSTGYYAFDTRAHIHQHLGNKVAAMTDYLTAVRNGGEPLVAIYQCGLLKAGVYAGPVDGKVSPALPRALKACIDRGPACDPLPPDESSAGCEKPR